MRTGRIWAVATVLALGAGAFTACGTTKQTVTTGPLANAYQATQVAKSAQLKLTLSIQTAAATQPVKVSGSGAFGWTPERGNFTISVGEAGQNISLPERTIGTNEYIEFPAPVAQFGNKRWLGIDLSQFFSGASSTSFDPTQELAVLEGQGTITTVGPQTVDGVVSTEYRATITPAKIGSNVSPAVRTLLKKLQSAGLSSIPVEVWIDRSGRPVRMTLTERLAKAPGGSSAAAASAFPETTTITMDFSGWGIPVTVSAPPTSEVYRVSASQLQQLGL